MASRTLVNGTGYDIKNGRTLVNGTGYSIRKGRTLVNGTGYDIFLNRYQLAPWVGSDGDQYVTVQIQVPRHLNQQARRKLMEYKQACG